MFSRGDRRLRERELGVPVGEVVGEVRVGGHLDPRRVLVDQEERGQALAPVDRPSEDDEVRRDVAVGHEPLRPGELVVVAVPDRLGLDRARVGAGVAFGDRVGVAVLAADVGEQVALDLLRRAVDQHVGGRPDQHPQAVREPAELLVRHDLLGQVEAAAPELRGDVVGAQARLEHRGVDAGVGLGREPPVVSFRLVLDRLQHVVDERANAGAKLGELGREREVHHASGLGGLGVTSPCRMWMVVRCGV